MKARQSLIALLFSVVSIFSLPVFAETKKFSVEGMTCEGCVSAIKAQLCKSPEIKTCNVEIGSVSLEYKDGVNLSDEAVIQKIKAVGYKAQVATQKTK